jgi:host factor-I protein
MKERKNMSIRGGLPVNKNNINLQDVFLNQVRKEHIAVTVYLTNGFQLKGLVKGFDNFTVVLDSEGRQQLIYKHAISTISPMKLVNLIFNDPRNDQ